MSDNPKEVEREMEKAIFICGDCWLNVFDLLPPSQLGLGIALISRRFDCFVEEHFKTRRWALENEIKIIGVIGQNGSIEMEIVSNSDEKALPIPQNQLPNKVIGFSSIFIHYIDQNVLVFLRRFHRFFSVCATKLYILTENVHISEFIMRNIWPMFKDTIDVMSFNSIAFRKMRQFAPSMLNDCPSLRVVVFDDGILPEFPPDDSANASEGQAVAKWLFTPRPDNLQKIISIKNLAVDQWLTTVEQIKAAFSSASSPGAFSISIDFPSSSPIDSVVPFGLTNQLTGEKLALSQENANVFMLIRYSIVPDDKKRQKSEKELGDRWNQMKIAFTDSGIDDGLLGGSSPGPNGQQKQQKMKCMII